MFSRLSNHQKLQLAGMLNLIMIEDINIRLYTDFKLILSKMQSGLQKQKIDMFQAILKKV